MSADETAGLPRLVLAPLILPALAVTLLTFLWPMLRLAGYAFHEGAPGGAIGADWTLATWAKILGDGWHHRLVLNSLALAVTVTALTLAVSYPLALAVHRSPPRRRNALVIVCVSPLLLSAVVRSYGWLPILGDQGLVPGLLRGFGVEPPPLLFNRTGVVVGLVEILMPYAILSLLAGFGRVSGDLEEAAASLGAPPFTVFRRVILPLSAPGILLGGLLSFVLTVSSFVTPKLLGGGRVPLVAIEIYDQAIVTLDWPVAAVLSLVTLLLFGLLLGLYNRVIRRVEEAIG